MVELTPTTTPLRIAIVGVGAIGGLFGARLVKAGHDVTFVARGQTLSVLQQDGLQVESIDGNIDLPSVTVTDDPSTIGPVDVVIVAVKATQVESIAPSLKPLLGPRTAIMPVQNGVEASAQLASALGDQYVLEGVCRVIVEQIGPGRIRHFAVSPVMEIGIRARTPADAPALMQIGPLSAALTSAGITVITPEQMEVALWEKFLFIEPFGLVGTATRVPIGTMRTVPETRALVDTCLHEVRSVAVAIGVPLTEEAVVRVWQRYDSLPADGTTSLQRDIIAGRLNEYDAQTGAVIRLARKYGVAIPAHDVLHAAMLPMVTGATRLG
jgi:2-dehydropantoate 2-reductase